MITGKREKDRGRRWHILRVRYLRKLQFHYKPISNGPSPSILFFNLLLLLKLAETNSVKWWNPGYAVKIDMKKTNSFEERWDSVLER